MPLQQDLAVCVLVDQSGSMKNHRRIDVAKEASIAIYSFCRKLKVPVFIAGHNYDMKKVHIYVHADYDSVDNKDKFRLMDICSGLYNHDGATIRFVLERLLKRTEKLKMFLLLSDGLPSADGYCGTVAEADLRGIKNEYTNKGILFFTAAIGDDHKTIKRIYGNSYLDMTDIQKLPQNLVRIISTFVK